MLPRSSPRTPLGTAARWALAPLALAGVLAGGLAGCPGSLQDPGRFALDGGGGGAGGCGDVPSTIFIPTCGQMGCHNSLGPSQKFDVVSPGFEARVVGKPAHECAGILVDPSNPEASVVYSKLTAMPPCGSQMPLTGPKLTDAQMLCVRDWIATRGPKKGSGGGGGGGGTGGAGGKGGGAGGKGGGAGGSGGKGGQGGH